MIELEFEEEESTQPLPKNIADELDEFYEYDNASAIGDKVSIMASVLINDGVEIVEETIPFNSDEKQQMRKEKDKK